MPTKIMSSLLFVTVGAILFATGYLVGTRHLSEARDQAYNDGMTAAVNEPLILDDTGGAPTSPSSDQPAERSTGQIVEVTSDRITVRMTATNRIFLINTETMFVERQNKPSEDLAREQRAYSARVAANPTLAEAPPTPYVDTPIAIDQLAVDDTVEILATPAAPGTDTATLVAKIISP